MNGQTRIEATSAALNHAVGLVGKLSGLTALKSEQASSEL
jgi:hypothetical protein